MDPQARSRTLALAGVALEDRRRDGWKRQPRDPGGDDGGQWVDSPAAKAAEAVKAVAKKVGTEFGQIETTVDWKGAHFTLDVDGRPLTVSISPLDVAEIALLFVPGAGLIAAGANAAKVASIVSKVRRALLAAKAAEIAAHTVASRPRRPATARERLLAAAGVEVRDWKAQPRDPGGEGGGQWVKSPTSALKKLASVLGSRPGGGPAVPPPALRDKAVGRNLADEMGLDALTARATEHGLDPGPNGDEAMVAIAKLQGFDGLPTVVSKAEFDSLVSGGGYTEIHRGLKTGGRAKVVTGKAPDGTNEMGYGEATNKTGAELAEQFRSGKYRAGFGAYGSGTYATPVGKTAADYAGADGAVLRMAIRPDARVVDYFSLARPKGSQDHYGSTVYQVFQDAGRSAAAMGVDVILVEQRDMFQEYPPEYVILNRSAVVVQEA